ncbi:DUF2786 domain-containing protein [Sphaerisporangium fuscum]|uniref:DUF2786 domain-containing protein n=1 Tax=Sphaerisporangium fuscum TaxID=2835868 RepID=UPI001BDC7F3C|nr:DUF2786 domain-containing protein [Sphaerisporangium fuscum]
MLTNTEDAARAKIMERVRRLLDLAEHPNTGEEEAAVASAHAAALMLRHGLDAAAVRRGSTGRGETIDGIEFEVSNRGGHARERCWALHLVCDALGCKGAQHWTGVRGRGIRAAKRVTMTVIGPEAVLDSLRILLPSITLQMENQVGPALQRHMTRLSEATSTGLLASRPGEAASTGTFPPYRAEAASTDTFPGAEAASTSRAYRAGAADQSPARHVTSPLVDVIGRGDRNRSAPTGKTDAPGTSSIIGAGAATITAEEKYRRARTSTDFRRAFYVGFGSGVSAKLRERVAEVAEQVKGTGAELVLLDRTALVQAEFDRRFPGLRRARATQLDPDGYDTGLRAGRQADLNDRNLGTMPAGELAP